MHASAKVSSELLDVLDARIQQIGQLELVAAVAAYYSMAEYVKGRDVLHWVDNTGAVYGLAKGSARTIDSAKIVNALYALNEPLQAQIDFRWVASEANIADLPSRDEFELLESWGSVSVPFRMPPVAGWLSEAEAMQAAGAAQTKKRGGRRGK